MSTAAMRAGRRRWQREQDRQARERVRQFRRWLAAGSDLRTIPPIPTKTDYDKAATAAGRNAR